MALPELQIDLGVIGQNARAVSRLATRAGIEIVGVTKAVCADTRIAAAMLENGVQSLGDSRLENLKHLAGFAVRRMLLRLPAPSECETVVRQADVSLVSQTKTAEALAAAAQRAGWVHHIILMVELGDLREGLYGMPAILDAAGHMDALPGLVLEGLGANFSCLGGVHPDAQNMAALCRIREKVEGRLGRRLSVVSGGNSSSLYFLMQGTLPAGITQLRIGEALLLGNETVYGMPIPGGGGNSFLLRAEILEICRKPSRPYGPVAGTGFGAARIFEDRGLRMRAICGLGLQDIDAGQLVPVDGRIEIIGASSDHLVLDIELCREAYRVGDVVEFRPLYSSILRAMASPHVAKSYMGMPCA